MYIYILLGHDWFYGIYFLDIVFELFGDGSMECLRDSVAVVVAHAPYRTYSPPWRHCLGTVEFEYYRDRSWIPASLFDVDR